MVVSESGGTIRHRTAYSQNLREYESSNQTSGIREPFYDISCKGRAVHGADEKNLQYFFAVVNKDKFVFLYQHKRIVPLQSIVFFRDYKNKQLSISNFKNKIRGG